MTCIIASAYMMAADRRITDDGASSSMVKVAKSRWLIAAASGNASSTLAVKRAVAKGAKLASDLIECVDRESYALVLSPEGLLTRVQDGMLWPCRSGQLHGIGSGCDLALGYLEALGAPDQPTAWRQAFRFVASRRADCGGGVDFRSFG